MKESVNRCQKLESTVLELEARLRQAEKEKQSYMAERAEQEGAADGDCGARLSSAACQHCGANLKGVARGVGRKLGTVPKGFCNTKCFEDASAGGARAEQTGACTCDDGSVNDVNRPAVKGVPCQRRGVVEYWGEGLCQ